MNAELINYFVGINNLEKTNHVTIKHETLEEVCKKVTENSKEFSSYIKSGKLCSSVGYVIMQNKQVLSNKFELLSGEQIAYNELTDKALQLATELSSAHLYSFVAVICIGLNCIVYITNAEDILVCSACGLKDVFKKHLEEASMGQNPNNQKH